jgi:hypothetical protein
LSSYSSRILVEMVNHFLLSLASAGTVAGALEVETAVEETSSPAFAGRFARTRQRIIRPA